MASALARKSGPVALLGMTVRPVKVNTQGMTMVTPLRISPRDGVTVYTCAPPSFRSPLAGVLRVILKLTASLSQICTLAAALLPEMPTPPVAADRVTVRFSCASFRLSLTMVRVTVLSAWSAAVKVRVRPAAAAG